MRRGKMGASIHRAITQGNMKLKPGVKLKDLQPQIVVAMVVVDSIYQAHDTDCVITSCNDSTHKPDSFHYRGLAIDVRTRNYFEDKQALRDEIAQALGEEFDVLLEGVGTESEHLHIEHDA